MSSNVGELLSFRNGGVDYGEISLNITYNSWLGGLSGLFVTITYMDKQGGNLVKEETLDDL